MSLRKFAPSELALSNQQAWQVLVYFFGGNASSVPGDLTDNDRSFAQALLLEAVDKSYQMSWIETLWKSSASPTSSVSGILRSLATKAARDWLSHCQPNDLAHAKIYQIVKDRLVGAWRDLWRLRIDTGEPIY
jgi:hypothetical protein